MGVAIIFGMLLSTFLTLFVVPAIYSLLDDAVLAWSARRNKPTAKKGKALPSARRAR
jgi:uncharacterized membrane protein YdfJ with MMPL/SSD domain